MTRVSAQPQPLPFHATTPGFALAKAWCARHKPALAEALAAVADAPPLLPFEEFEEGDDEPLHQPLRRDALPLELTLILTLARALEAAGGQRPGAPAQIALVHGWGAGMVMQLDKLLRDDAIARAFLVPARDRPKILILAQDGSSESVQADRRKALARQIPMALMVGRGVVVLGAAPGDLPADMRRLGALELRLSRPDRATVAALLALLFPEPESSLAPEALPPDDALARLSVLELTIALHAPSLDAALAALHRSARPEVHSQPVGVTGLATVAGQDAAVSVLRRLGADITAWREGRLRWQAVPRSLIFHGPPGTGKTLMAQAFAIESGLPLIATSFADCQKAGHMGDMLAALETAVAEAENRAPSVFFLDELDGFSSRLSEARGRNEGYMRGVITGLLRQIDRLMATEGVVMIGATNHLDAIDPAIRRAGRFDTVLAIDPPDRAGLAQILRHHLDAPVEAAPDGPALKRAIALAAERLIGTNGAEAAALARATLARVRETGAPLAEALLAELDTRHRGLTPTDQRRIALHEAGHVVVGVLSGLPEPQALRLTPHGGEVRWPAVPIHTFKSAQAELRMLAGRAAEEVFLGTPSSSAGAGPDSDLAHATRLALSIETEWGLGDGGLIWHPGMPLTLQSPPWLREKVDHLLTTARAEARAVVATHRNVVEELAEALLDAREMKGEVLQGWVRRISRSAHPARRNVRDGVIALDPG